MGNKRETKATSTHKQFIIGQVEMRETYLGGFKVPRLDLWDVVVGQVQDLDIGVVEG